jgi:hypothetical protein
MSTPKITKKSFKIKRYNNYCITIVIIKKCYIYIYRIGVPQVFQWSVLIFPINYMSFPR